MDAKPETLAEPSAFSIQAKRRNLIILLVALGIILNGLFNFLTSQGKSNNEMIRLGTPMPAFSLKQADESVVSSVDFKGKPTIYFFFANWCPCSHASIDHLKKVVTDNAAQGVSLFGVGIQDTPSELAAFVKKHQMNSPVGINGGMDAANMLGVRTTPTTLFVDAGGIVRFIFIGKIERYEQISKGVESIIGKPSA